MRWTPLWAQKTSISTNYNRPARFTQRNFQEHSELILICLIMTSVKLRWHFKILNINLMTEKGVQQAVPAEEETPFSGSKNVFSFIKMLNKKPLLRREPWIKAVTLTPLYFPSMLDSGFYITAASAEKCLLSSLGDGLFSFSDQE